MSRMNVEIAADTYFACLAALRVQHSLRPDPRYVGALDDLRIAMLREVDREIAAVSEPPQPPALLRKQAG